MSVVQGPDHESEQELATLLRRSLRDAGDGFDYPALVHGVHARAQRMRRRRAVGTLAAAAVLGPALVGGAVWLPDVLGAGPTDIAPADQDGATSTLVQEQTPPYQDGDLPLPEGGESFAAIDNAWEIPDARPTGVDLLEELGAPDLLLNYPRLPVLDGLMVCDPGNPGGAEPLAGQSWGYSGTTASSWESLTIQVTGWDDGAQALADLHADALLCAWDRADGTSVRAPAGWPGHEDDPDRYLNEPFRADGGVGEQLWVAGAVVREGDYLVGVSVRHTDQETADAAAREVAEKTAANLAVLDPDHAGG